MIVSLIIYCCPKCGSLDIVKNGTDYKNEQKYHCHNCRAYGTLNAQKGYTEEEKEQILKAYQERASMRGVSRIFGVARQILAKWLKEKASQLPPYQKP